MHLIGEYPSGEGLEFLRGAEQPSRYSKIYSVSLQLSEGEYSASGRLSYSPAGSQTPLHSWRRLRDSGSITNNHGDDSQNSLATITT